MIRRALPQDTPALLALLARHEATSMFPMHNLLGHARRAVAMHLAEASRAGIKRAVLFAANDQAARAYTAPGFRPSHRFALILFTEPQQVAP